MCPQLKQLSEMEQRAAVVAEARTWKGTPFHLNARVKGAGISCGGLIFCCFQSLGLIEDETLPLIKPDWHLHNREEKLEEWVKRYCVKVDRKPLPGDIIMYQYGRVLSHMALVVDWPVIIHSTLENKGVLEDPGTDVSLLARQRAIYSFWR